MSGTVGYKNTGGGDGGGRVEDATIFIRSDKNGNEYIIEIEHAGRFGEKTREARLRWYSMDM